MGKSICGQGVDGIFVCAVYPPACEFAGSIECGLLLHITVAPKGNYVSSLSVCVASCPLQPYMHLCSLAFHRKSLPHSPYNPVVTSFHSWTLEKYFRGEHFLCNDGMTAEC
jgi:hypothetical protein